MTTTAPAQPVLSPLEAARRHFLADTADHQMRVLRDEGLYRHLRFRRAGFEFRSYEVEHTVKPSGFFQFDLVTWPGYLAFVGDCGDYLFSRLPDMFEFFAPRDGDYIAYDYWAEKLVAPQGSRAVRSFSEDHYRRQVEAWIADQDAPVARAARRQLLDTERPGDSAEAHRLLREFEHDGVAIWDPWEWEFTDYDHRYLWACCAISWGVGSYLKARAPAAAV